MGTCWAGFFEICASIGYKPLMDILSLSESMTVTGGLIILFFLVTIFFTFSRTSTIFNEIVL
ncbi:nitroreductase domain protein [Desulfosporosinus sp. OT]|nr:nitroreductase domain protein [Desulfosporosinus sp. OT]